MSTEKDKIEEGDEVWCNWILDGKLVTEGPFIYVAGPQGQGDMYKVRSTTPTETVHYVNGNCSAFASMATR